MRAALYGRSFLTRQASPQCPWFALPLLQVVAPALVDALDCATVHGLQEGAMPISHSL
jgi:hypothetical protein